MFLARPVLTVVNSFGQCYTVGIRLADMSKNPMTKSSQMAEWCVIQVNIWLPDQKSGN